jgi:hypothetical protein
MFINSWLFFYLKHIPYFSFVQTVCCTFLLVSFIPDSVNLGILSIFSLEIEIFLTDFQ